MKLKISVWLLASITLSLLSSVTVWADLSKTEVSQLYVSIFGRASEGEGNVYWKTLEIDMATTADVMLDTDAARNYFGANLNTNQAFIEHIYLNTLNKTIADDFEGISYWIGLLDAGTSRGSVVASLVGVIKDYAPDGPYYDPDNAATIAAYWQFTNRVTVSDYMADTVLETPENWETVTKFNAGGLNVTDDYHTVAEMFVMIDSYSTVFVYAGTWSGSYSGTDSGDLDFTVRSDGYVHGRAYSNYLQNYLNIRGSVSNSGFLTADAAGNNFSGQMTKEGTVSGIWSDTYVSGVFSAVQTVKAGDSPLPGECGAYITPNVWKEFDCYNLAAIGKTTGDDPFTPSWRLIGGYWQWGRKGPSSSQWHDTNTEHFAHGPTGPDADRANIGEISVWDETHAPNGSWSDASKTVNDPCPAGYRVPTITQWGGVSNNNIQSSVGSWSESATNYNSARFFGNALMLPVAGFRSYGVALSFRGRLGKYWSSTQVSSTDARHLHVYSSNAFTNNYSRRYGLSVRCIAE